MNSCTMAFLDVWVLYHIKGTTHTPEKAIVQLTCTVIKNLQAQTSQLGRFPTHISSCTLFGVHLSVSVFNSSVQAISYTQGCMGLQREYLEITWVLY